MTLSLETPLDALLAARRQLGARPIRVYIPGAAAEPLALADQLEADSAAAGGMTFLGAWIPGVNRIDWSRFGDGAETTFSAPDWAEGRRSGRMRIRPLAYSQTWDWLATTPLDLAIVQVSPPDAAGDCNMSLTADFTAAILARDVPVIGLLNRALPVIAGAPSVPLSRFSWTVEVDRAPPTYDPGVEDPVTLKVAANTAALIPDGAVIQTGIGKLGAAVFSALTARRNLRIHSGMASDSVIDLIEAGSLAETPGAITVGAILGSAGLGARLADERRLVMVPVPQTHGYATLSAINGLAAVNSAVEIDLFGQANAEQVGGKLISGVGGLSDFLRGAGAAPGGLPILALPAETPNGKHSRIVARLGAGVTTLSRTEVAIVVTEHGATDLRGLDMDRRAEALISVAAPDRRAGLAQAWDEIRRSL